MVLISGEAVDELRFKLLSPGRCEPGIVEASSKRRFGRQVCQVHYEKKILDSIVSCFGQRSSFSSLSKRRARIWVMAAIWKDMLKPGQKGWPTPDLRSSLHMWGFPLPPTLPASLAPREVWHVRVCSFTFDFQSLDQLEACLGYYRQKIHPSSLIPWERLGDYGGDCGECQRWYERLPMYLLEEPKRKKVVTALERALDLWKQDQRKHGSCGNRISGSTDRFRIPRIPPSRGAPIADSLCFLFPVYHWPNVYPDDN